MNKIADIRTDYAKQSLDIKEVASLPITQFRRWFEEAINAKIEEPNAMSLSTIKEDNTPSCRIVLLKEVTDEGFVFFTNYESDKGKEIATNGKAAINFFWKELERQVRIEGIIEKVPAAVSDEYFASRPRSSQVGAWVSPQSNEVPDRAYLENKFIELTEKFEGQEITRPPHWGGFVLLPNSVEFWQGRPSRLHDRIKYTRVNSEWKISRLAP